MSRLHRTIVYMFFLLIIVTAITNLYFYAQNKKKQVKSYHKFPSLKYILIWSNPKTYPFSYFDVNPSVFFNLGCRWTNCLLTNDSNTFYDVTDFDAVLFHGPELYDLIENRGLPSSRSNRQKYIFASLESSGNYPVCENRWNGFFNLTWTYKLDSDAKMGYVTVRDKEGRFVGPATNASWLRLDEMEPIDEELKLQLQTKTKAVAWIVSNCETLSERELLAEKIRSQLYKYNLYVDVFGHCGTFNCTPMSKCLELLKRHYYFYFAFENTLSEDYVTEKIVLALRSHVVPIVYGGANYSRFMPDGIYLNALTLRPDKLAHKIAAAVRDPSEYHKFFRWHKHYTYHYSYEFPDTESYCHLCAMMNDAALMNTITVYQNFTNWWTGEANCQRPDLLRRFVYYVQT